MRGVILYIWQLPQNLLGFLLVYVYYALGMVVRFDGEDGIMYAYVNGVSAGVSLGRYVVLKASGIEDGRQKYHEYGHCMQSRFLGPLYLLVIGLPSLVGNIYDRIAHRSWSYERSYKWYYAQPWEAWADKLGKVIRNE